MNRRPRGIRRTAAIAVALAVTVAACGSDDDADEPADEPATTETDADEPADEGASSTSAAADEPAEEPAELEEVKLNIGYIDTSINGVGVIAIANELGLWDEYAIDANLIPFTNGPTQIQAMQSGELDIGYIGGGAVWLPASGQATVITPSEASIGERVIAAADLNATSMEDLRGKKVGVPEGGSGEMILALALDSAGMTMDDIEPIVLDPPSIVSAFVSGSVDAAAIFSPLSDQILESAPDSTILAQNTDYEDTVFLGAWVANNDAMTEKRDEIVRFLSLYADVNDFRVGDVEATVQYASDESGVPPEQLAGQASVSQWWPTEEILANNADGTTFTWFEGLEQVFVTTGRLEQVNPAADWVNTELLAEAAELRR